MIQERELHLAEKKIGRYLRIGVLLSFFFLLVGEILQISSGLADFRLRLGETGQENFFQLWTQDWSQHHFGAIFLWIGLVILILLPALRLLGSGVILLTRGERFLGLCALLTMGLVILGAVLGATL